MVSRKKASVIVVTVFWLIVILTSLGTVRSFTQVSRLDVVEYDLRTIQRNSRQMSRTEGTVDITLVTTVMNEFVPLFMNVDLREQNEIDGRLERLSDFVSFDIRNINNGINRDEQRLLENYELIAIAQYSSFNIATFRVSYQIIDHSEDEENNEYDNYDVYDIYEKETNESSLVLHIPFVMQDGLISIVSMPYFTAESGALAHTVPFEKMVENDTSDEMRIARASIEEFLPMFFEMYAGSNEQSLGIFMSEVILMGGSFELEEVNNFDARFDFVEENVLVQVSVVFRDNGTNFIHEVPFTLLLEEQANSWFVLELHHLFIR